MTATTEQLLALLLSSRSYMGHPSNCPRGRNYAGTWTHLSTCVCGLDTLLRGIDAMLAGRVTNHPERPESSTVEDAIDAFQDACHRHAREAVLGADDDKPSAALAAHDAKMALIRIISGDNHPEAPNSSTGDDDGN